MLKLGVTISLTAQILAFSEGLLLAERGGIDPQIAARVMSTSAIGSLAVEGRVPLVLDLPEPAWFDVRMIRKYIRLALDAGHDDHVAFPSASVAHDMLAKASELGHDGRDAHLIGGGWHA